MGVLRFCDGGDYGIRTTFTRCKRQARQRVDCSLEEKIAKRQ